MKLILKLTFVFCLFSINSHSQIDYSVLLKKKISKSNLKSFAKLWFYKSHIDSECIVGDCNNNFSTLKQSFRYRDGNNDKHIDCIYIIGNFKNGKLNGQGTIYVINHTNTRGIDEQLKSGNYDLIDNPKYTEFITSDFENNVATNGVYSYRKEHKSSAASCYHNKTILVKSKLWNKNTKPLFSKHFSDVSVKSYFKPTLQIFYHGKFPSMSFRDDVENGKNKEYSKIEINYFYKSNVLSSKGNYIRYSLYPQEYQEHHFVDYKIASRYKVFERNSFIAQTENGKCSNCDIIDISQFANDQKNRNERKIRKEKLDKYTKARNFLGQFIGVGTSHYYVNEIDNSGCVNLIPFPTKAYVLNFKDGTTKNQARKMIVQQPENRRSCKLDYYTIKHVKVCPSCAGAGKVTFEDLRKYRKVVWEKGKYKVKHVTKDDAACKVCQGLGVVRR